MTIYLLRHGKTLANEKRLFYGFTDLPLSQSGIQEIEELIAQGHYPPADMVFASGLLRARQTAGMICCDAEITKIPDLNEYNFGLFEMKSYDELKDRPDFQAWINDDTGLTECPCGESGQVFKQRVKRGFQSVLDETGRAGKKSALIVCHGGTIVRIMEWLFPDTRNYPEWQPDPGYGYSIFYTHGSPSSYHDI